MPVTIIIRAAIAIIFIIIGIYWFIHDWLWAGNFFEGLSYFWAALGLAGLSFVGISWLATVTSFTIAELSSLCAVLALVYYHPATNLILTINNARSVEPLAEIAAGAEWAQGVDYITQQKAQQVLAACATQNGRNDIDFLEQAEGILFLRPEWSALQRLYEGAPIPPPDACAEGWSQLYKMQPSLHEVKEPMPSSRESKFPYG